MRRHSKHGVSARSIRTLLQFTRHELSSGRNDTPSPPKRSRKYDAEDVRAIVTAYQSGMTVYQVARKYGCSRQAVSNYVKAAGITMRSQALPEEVVTKVCHLRAQGRSWYAIGRELGIDPGTAKRRAERLAPTAH